MLIADCVCKLIINHNICKIVLSIGHKSSMCMFCLKKKKSEGKSNSFREQKVHSSIGEKLVLNVLRF